MISRTIVIKMEITKEFDLTRHRGVLNLTLPKLNFHPFLKSMGMSRRKINLQRMKWWLQLRSNSKGGSQPMEYKWCRDLQ